MLLIISTNFIPFCISMHHKNAPVTGTPSGDNCIWHLRCQLKHSLNQLWKITMFYSELPHSPTVNFLWFSRQLLVISESCIQTFLTCQLSSNIPVWYPDNLNDICRGNLSPFFTGRMPFLSPNQQCQSTEGKTSAGEIAILKEKWVITACSCRYNYLKISWHACKISFT